MNPIAQQKIEGMYKAMAARPDRELMQARQRYMQMITANKKNPDEGLIGNLRWNLNMINTELGRRHPKQKKVAPKVNVSSFDASTSNKESSIDELKQYLTKANEQIANDKLSQESRGKMEAEAKVLSDEIASRNAINETAQKEISTATSSSRKKVAAGVILGAGAGAFVAWKFGKNMWACTIGGAALGTAVAFYVNKKSKSTLVQSKNK